MILGFALGPGYQGQKQCAPELGGKRLGLALVFSAGTQLIAQDVFLVLALVWGLFMGPHRS